MMLTVPDFHDQDALIAVRAGVYIWNLGMHSVALQTAVSF